MAVAELTFISNCRITIASPERAVALIVSMPLIVLTASSIGLITSFSTASGEAPG